MYARCIKLDIAISHRIIRITRHSSFIMVDEDEI